MRPESRIRTEAIAGALAAALGLIGLFVTPIWLKVLLVVFTVVCLFIAAFPRVAVSAERLWRNGGEDDDEIPEWAKDIYRKLDIIVAALPTPTSSVSIAAPAAEAQASAHAASVEISPLGVSARGEVGTVGAVARSFAAIQNQLSRVSGKVEVMALMGDDESLRTAKALAGVFRSANWTITNFSRVGFSRPVEGIYIQARSPESASAGFVQSIFASVGVKTKGSIVPTMPEDEIGIIVGGTER